VDIAGHGPDLRVAVAGQRLHQEIQQPRLALQRRQQRERVAAGGRLGGRRLPGGLGRRQTRLALGRRRAAQQPCDLFGHAAVEQRDEEDAYRQPDASHRVRASQSAAGIGPQTLIGPHSPRCRNPGACSPRPAV